MTVAVTAAAAVTAGNPIKMVTPAEGLEPPTTRLRAVRSTKLS